MDVFPEIVDDVEVAGFFLKSSFYKYTHKIKIFVIKIFYIYRNIVNGW
jgi:hypothetical protein